MPPKKSTKRTKVSIIRFIYLYLITAITFIVFIIGAVNIVNQAFKSFIFGVEEYDYSQPTIVEPVKDCEMYLKADEIGSNQSYEDCLLRQKTAITTRQPKTSKFTNEAKRTLSIGIAQVLVGFPLWIFHWGIIERDRKERRRSVKA